jgi:acyl-coenzyme A thioesterase PaaI-like protein
MTTASLQEQLAPASTCFGCGPANASGLHVRSHRAPDGPGLVGEWRPSPAYEAFAGSLNGGIVGTLLDCHANWTAAVHLMDAAGATRLPSTVTSDLAIRYLRPTPTDGPITLRAHVVESTDRRATVEASLDAGGATCATARATFVAVGPGHPAYGRW